MEEKALELLDRYGVVVLPETINHDAYRMLVEAVLRAGDKSLTLYCRGDGGGSRSAMAMVDLIRQHGNVTGLLYGEANSSHGIVFAACQKRFISDYASLGIHMVAYDSIETRVDATVLQQMANDYRRMDADNAEILAAASNRSAEWWQRVIEETGSGGLRMFSALELREMELARPIAEYQTVKAQPAVPAGTMPVDATSLAMRLVVLDVLREAGITE